LLGGNENIIKRVREAIIEILVSYVQRMSLEESQGYSMITMVTGSSFSRASGYILTVPCQIRI